MARAIETALYALTIPPLADRQTMTMWWRVRAIASDGTVGACSAVRRFELK